jgi:hypothetical protein
MKDWDDWVSNHSHIALKLKGVDRTYSEAYFLKLHAATEALLRRILFVGLRLNMVSFSDASDWLHHNDSTPTKIDFLNKFNKLYGPDLKFETVLADCPHGQLLWDLWHDFAKPVRNHLAHGIRAYNPSWLECGARINQSMLIELDVALAKRLGGSIADDLTKLHPRLPTGRKGIDIPALFGLKKGRQPRPSISLVDAQNRLILAGL